MEGPVETKSTPKYTEDTTIWAGLQAFSLRFFSLGLH